MEKNNLIICLILLIIIIGGMIYLKKEPEDTIDINLENAVSKAILEYNKSVHYNGELQTEGHKIFKVEELGKTVKAYCMFSYSEMRFENGTLTVVKGASKIMVLLIFEKDEEGNYQYISHQEPVDGEGNADSLQRIFPKDVLKMHNKYDTEELDSQQKRYVEEYLKSAI